jgi:hypothetical protein
MLATPIQRCVNARQLSQSLPPQRYQIYPLRVVAIHPLLRSWGSSLARIHPPHPGDSCHGSHRSPIVAALRSLT